MRPAHDTSPRRGTQARFATAAGACLAVLTLICTGPASSSGAPASPQRPNVIVVLTDDETVGELSPQTMPETIKAFADNGTTFTNSIVSSPLCCPSRAGFLTGQYPHNSGVFDNEPGYAALNGKSSIIYSWLQAAGYRTGHAGRFLLNYDRAAPLGQFYDTQGGFAAPAGVEDWYGYVGSQTQYTGATFSDNGSPVVAGTGKAGYSTRMINRAALDFVRTAKSDPRPFFLMVAHLAPHASNFTAPGPCGQGGLPVPEDNAAYAPFKDQPLPKPPSFDEQKIGDKPDWVATRPHLGHSRRANLKLGLRCAMATLSTVDRGVGELVDQLEREGELDNTAIFFTSDNGYFFGEHRIYLNKVYPYEEALRVPLLALIPPTALGPKAGRDGQPAEVSAPVNNVDLTATILDLAGATPCTTSGDCRTLDGRSLRPLLNGKRPAWSRGRTLLYQLGGIRTCGLIPTDRGLNNYYDAIRTKRYTYVELNRVNKETGQCDRPEYELYDLKQDPYQLRNRAVDPALATPSPLQLGLAARLAALRQCSGIAGRDAPGSRPFCD
jgi:N-acetylglucosamine-6-sulfatase